MYNYWNIIAITKLPLMSLVRHKDVISKMLTKDVIITKDYFTQSIYNMIILLIITFFIHSM